jgi:hypothetical protein
MRAIASPSAVSGSKLLEACNYDRRLLAVLIAQRDDWPDILDSIPAGQMRRNAAGAVYEIRTALGLEASFALGICQEAG